MQRKPEDTKGRFPVADWLDAAGFWQHELGKRMGARCDSNVVANATYVVLCIFALSKNRPTYAHKHVIFNRPVCRNGSTEFKEG